MKFSDQLNIYLSSVHVTHKELAEASQLSTATISRYCSGERVPAYNSEQIQKLAQGIFLLYEQKGMPLVVKDVLNVLNGTVENGLKVDYTVFLANLNYLLKKFDIRSIDLARGIHNDASHISKILSGNRKPGNIDEFIQKTSFYLAKRLAQQKYDPVLAQILNKNMEAFQSPSDLQQQLILWLSSNPALPKESSLSHFLSKMDDFDMNDYLRIVHFDEIKNSNVPFRIPLRKEYTGIDKMMESELDFIMATALDKTNEPMIIYSDMPLEEMAADPDFSKKYLLGMVMLLKKGIRIHFIHDIHRPFEEMMLGLESYIPIYMTGQIAPFYLPYPTNDIFLHLLKVSGNAALEGMATAGDQAAGKYILYRSEEDVRHYRIRAKKLLKKALPLMKIFSSDEYSNYIKLLESSWKVEDRKIICNNIPVYTMSEALLKTILTHADISDRDRSKINGFHQNFHTLFFSAIKSCNIHLVIPQVNEEQYRRFPLKVSLADLYMDSSIFLTYEEYTRYISELQAIANDNSHLLIELNPFPTFHNLNISMIGNQMVIVSKEKSPVIHFVIHHKKMIEAFWNFMPVMKDHDV